MLKSLVVTYIISFGVNAGINPNPESINSSNISNEILKIKTEIQQIDNSLVLKNKEYLQTMTKRQNLDIQVYEIENNLTSNIQILEEKKSGLDLLLKKALITSMTENDTEELMRNQILIKRIKSQKSEVQLQIENEQKLRSSLIVLKSQFEEKSAVERDLYEVVNKLEAQKSKIVKTYLDYKERESELRSRDRIVKTKARSNIESDTFAQIQADFISPISAFLTKEHQEKGITYNVKNNEEILASKGGKVIHSGVLANYGNVMIIDHGNDIRSIYLGDMTPIVAKDDIVKAEQIIAKTNVTLKKESIGKVYFEIRNKNKVQNTIKLVKLNNRV